MPPEVEQVIVLARTTTLEGLALALRDRRQSLGLPQLLVDEIGGLQSGYTGKIEAEALNPGRGKGLGKLTIPLLLGALDVEIALVPGPAQHRGERRESLRQKQADWGRAGRAKQLATQTPRQRKRVARAAARARWARLKA